jgi:UDP-glucose 4-epimerase
MKAFISGGAGFIGSHLAQRLLLDDETHRVIIYDNFSSGSTGHIATFSNDLRLQVVCGDLKNLDVVVNAMQGCDTIFHLAANPDISKAVTQPDIDFWEGTYLTQNVLEAMRITGAERIFYTSGSGVYGDDSSIAFTENHGPCIPISAYGASKLACEALIASYCFMFGIAGRVFRFANVVGPRQTHGIGYDFVRRLKNDPSRLRILGDGTQCKSYIHVEDVLNAVFTAGEKCTKNYDVFNVATQDYITVKNIADIAVRLYGIDPEQVVYEFTGGDRGWKGDVPIVRFDCSKIKSLGWACRRSSEHALLESMTAMMDEISQN